MRPFALVALFACSTPAPPATTPASASLGTTRWPPIIDSHVHLALYPVADELATSGVLGAVDLAAPERALGDGLPIHVIRSGPMLTHPGGYPLDAWGSDGYGIGCGDATCVRTTIDRLASEGARVIKLALDDDGLAPALVPVAVEAAHAHQLKVAAHALSADGARLAGRAGVDVLAHTPVEPLPQDVVDMWKGRAVISTLAAFGSSEAVDNLRRLRAAGAIILYGTDLGNTREPGPSADEVSRLREAGLDDAAIAAAMTTAPAAYWGITFSADDYLELDGDPRRDVRQLLTPRAVHAR